MRKLASVQRITDLRDVAGTDFLQVARVLGWNVIVSKNDKFRVGDLCVYIEVDSQLPEWPEFEFLRKKDFKIKTMKMRGEISQGLVLPISVLPHAKKAGFQVLEGEDVTADLKITQFNAPKPIIIQNGKIVQKRVYRFGWIPQPVMRFLYDNAYWAYKLLTRHAGDNFPPFVPKTDETRVQVLQPLLDKYQGQRFYITEKMDGQSWTGYLNKGKFGICSRNIDLELNNTDHPHVEVGLQLNMEQNLRTLKFLTGNDWALQGELVGPGIQGNKLKLEERDIYFFNAFNIDKQRYADLKEFKIFTDILGLKRVPIISEYFILINDIDALVKLAEGDSVITPGVKREGIVIRPLVDTLDFSIEGMVRGRLSFKAVSPEWLLEYKE